MTLPFSDFFDPAQIYADAGFSTRWQTPAAKRPLVTSRTNSHVPLTGPREGPEDRRSAFRMPRAYVQACGKGTLGLYYADGRVVFGPMACGSWSCPSCRRRLAARLLDRIRRGMESREEMRRSLITLTVDPAAFGARRLGVRLWDAAGNEVKDARRAVRRSVLWSEPTRRQFRKAAAAMSTEWARLSKALGSRARRDGVVRIGYFRVIELHRNGWPHYHLVVEHPEWCVGDEVTQVSHAHDLAQMFRGWRLGRVDARAISLDAAVGELAPYLVCSERKGNGSKAYQFAATSLPERFRLHSSSRGFLADAVSTEEPAPDHGLVLRGSWWEYGRTLASLDAEVSWDVEPVAWEERDEEVPRGRVSGTGDGAVVYYAALVDARATHAPEAWYQPLMEWRETVDARRCTGVTAPA